MFFPCCIHAVSMLYPFTLIFSASFVFSLTGMNQHARQEISANRNNHKKLFAGRTVSMQVNMKRFQNERNHNSNFWKYQFLAAKTTDFKEDKNVINILSSNPRIFTIENFLKPEECMEFINRAKSISSSGLTDRRMTQSNPPEVSISISRLWPLPFLSIFAGLPPTIHLFSDTKLPDSSTVQISIQKIIETAFPNVAIASCVSILLVFFTSQMINVMSFQASRTSEAMAFNKSDDLPFINSIVLKACEVSGIPNFSYENLEAPVITRYETGAIFSTHNDASPAKGSEWKHLGGQRVFTMIIYLTSVYNGGETFFDKLNINVKPKQGMALIFYPSDINTLEADHLTTHESKVTLEGENEKWIIQIFGRICKVPPPLGIKDEFNEYFS